MQGAGLTYSPGVGWSTGGRGGGSGWRAREGAPLPCPPPHALPGQQRKQDARVACSRSGQQPAASLSPSLGSGVLPEGPSSRHRRGAGAPGEQGDRSPGLPSRPHRCVSARPINPRPRSTWSLHPKSLASLDGEPSSQIPGLARRGAFIPNPWPRSTGAFIPNPWPRSMGSLHSKSLVSLDGEPPSTSVRL